RWEFDKNPDAFFDALDQAAARGASFRVALLGENFQMVPKAFIAGRERLGDRVVRYGYTDSREAYLQWLREGAVVVSTAFQENFGISMVEAIRFGCFPLAPRRLAYPEVIPGAFHGDCLYDDQSDLVEKLTRVLTDFPRFFHAREKLAEAMGRHAWENRVDAFDDELERLVGASGCEGVV
ncbi:MAG: glycosyltransferase family 4 protein, partial [Desulfobacterales bacterium]|nr:glycosyltransferase family 4 protein [Desulfobacterales bacterium]